MLAQKQEIQRQTSINLVMCAIVDLNADRYRIKIKDLMEYTGLSRSIFAKPHIRQILVSKGISKPPLKGDTDQKTSASRAAHISNLENKLRQKDEYIHRLTTENNELKDECALLRGKLFLLMQRQ